MLREHDLILSSIDYDSTGRVKMVYILHSPKYDDIGKALEGEIERLKK